MANVQVIANNQMEGQTDKRTGQKKYAPDLSMQGHKIKKCSLLCSNTDSLGNIAHVDLHV